MQEPRFDEQAAENIEALNQLDVRCVDDQIGLHRRHLENLARFQTTKVDPELWAALKRCKGKACPNTRCNAACAFGFAYAHNEYVLQAHAVIDSSALPKFAVAWVYPHYFRELGDLDQVSLTAVFQCVRRLLRKAPENWNDAVAVGSVHISLDVNLDGRVFWSPHVHLVLGVASNKKEIERVLRPPLSADPALIGKKFKPVVAMPVTNLANALSYAAKGNVDVRVQKLDRRGNSDRSDEQTDMPAEARRELDEYLLRHQPLDRLFFYGMMRTRGGITWRNRP
jgi:hypothetical protein